jgi:MFS family permease
MPGQTVGVSTFTDPLKDALQLSRDQISLAYMLGTITSSLFLGRAGKWFDRYGAGPVAFWATIGLVITLLLCSVSVNLSTGLQHLFGYKHWLIPFGIMVFLFFLLRFSGQGILTMASRNMIMKWFDKRRGRINAISSVVRSFSFSASPLAISILIDRNGWQGAWQVMALVLGLFSIIIWLFFKDNPEQFGLLPDGEQVVLNPKTNEKNSTKKQYTLKEAKQTRAYWMYSIILSFNAFFITGLTFHVVSVFSEAGFDRDTAISIFLPTSIVSVLISIIGNSLSDWIELKYLLYSMILGGIIAAIGLLGLSMPWGIYVLIAGGGIMGGLFSVLMAITWPRFYGRKHLGAISGKTMSMLVFASAIGPYLFSLSKLYLGGYHGIGWMSLLCLLILSVGSRKANRPTSAL